MKLPACAPLLCHERFWSFIFSIRIACFYLWVCGTSSKFCRFFFFKKKSINRIMLGKKKSLPKPIKLIVLIFVFFLFCFFLSFISCFPLLIISICIYFICIWKIEFASKFSLLIYYILIIFQLYCLCAIYFFI